MADYKVLYIYRNEEPKSRILKYITPKYFWTMCSADTDYCNKVYRPKMQLKYCKEELVEIDHIQCKSAEDCKKLQLSINMIFKAWTKGGGMKIFLDIDDDQFISHCHDIAKGLVDVDDIMHKYSRNKVSGTVYLAKCVNNKLKIGITTNLDKRREELKQEERNQVIDIIDTFESTNIAYDEAKLHELCDYYKTNSNKEVKCLQDCGNSELFEDCKEVMEIWNKYKEVK